MLRLSNYGVPYVTVYMFDESTGECVRRVVKRQRNLIEDGYKSIYSCQVCSKFKMCAKSSNRDPSFLSFQGSDNDRYVIKRTVLLQWSNTSPNHPMGRVTDQGQINGVIRMAKLHPTPFYSKSTLVL
ncbi:hypothetical protein SNE40_010032 [Patella caerulea]|uniref:Uncharacterized protein n=1 Tax=Patella caerulea TaxID=87958 RepID=A0AAN8PZE6_PATCE